MLDYIPEMNITRELGSGMNVCEYTCVKFLDNSSGVVIRQTW